MAAFGAVFASRMNSVLAASSSGAGPKLHVTGGSFDLAVVSSLAPAVKRVVFDAIAHGVQSVFDSASGRRSLPVQSLTARQDLSPVVGVGVLVSGPAAPAPP